MNTRNYRFAALSALVTACAGIAALQPSLALSAGVLTTRVVFQDLDLTNSSGIATLYGRLRAASVEVCRPLESKLVEGHFRHRDCVKSALDEAVAQVGKPSLTAYHQAKARGQGDA